MDNKATDEVRPTETQQPVAAPSSHRYSDHVVGGKSFMTRLLPVFACGAGLFSDGYINNVIGSVGTVLGLEYGAEYSGSSAVKNVASIAFAGTVVGMLFFGFLADHWSRTNTLMLSTTILIVFSALAAGSYYHGEAVPMFKMLVAWRFFVGVGIGGEYPAGSVACAEASGELKEGTRNMWFIMFTNTMIDWGFVFGALVPYLVACAVSSNDFGTIWRVSLGLGTLFPLVLFVMRLRLKEPEASVQNSMRHAPTPYLLILKFYGPRLLAVSMIWFIYDFSSYAFSVFSSSILSTVVPAGSSMTLIFGWNTLINLFYIPGSMLGAPLSDKIGARWALIIGVVAQAVVGFIMAGLYDTLSQSRNIAAFVVVFGIFLALGEVGPGNNIGLIASKTCATGVRGRYYGIAAAVGKVGAFVGTYIFKDIAEAGGNATESAQYPFYVAGSLCVVSALLTYFFIPSIGQDSIVHEDQRWRSYLDANNYDTSRMGLRRSDTEETGESQHTLDESTMQAAGAKF
ncbi:hypothetical protein HKX48_001470 [Thoreauomyces humboldtii]|nr:hypothetical protein HKX48_001470 [Thoreauomyces humboldtii]